MAGRARRTPYATVETTLDDVAPVDIQARAASARRDAFENVKPANRGMVDALLAERRGYVHRGGMEDRIAQVDEQLRIRGYGE
jgi:hypothetical protein